MPGVTSAIAAPAYAGIPVTHREVASLVTFVTGHEDPTKPGSALDWRQLAELGGTRVFLMGVERLRWKLRRKLQSARRGRFDAGSAYIRWGTTARQESIEERTSGTIAGLVEKRNFKPPAVIVVGEVVKLRHRLELVCSSCRFWVSAWW